MSNVPRTDPSIRATPVEKPATLLRQLGIVSATALVVSNMVGQGIFTSTGFLAGDLGRPNVVLGIWLVGAVVALAGAFCYSELGINFPSSGGEYVYLTRAYGPTWGFMTGWISFFAGFSAPIAAAGLAFSGYLSHFSPVLSEKNPMFTIGSGEWALKFGGAQIAASALIALFTLLNFFGVGLVAKIQNALTATKLVVIFSFMLLAFLIGSGSWDHFSMPVAQRTSDHSIPAQFVLSLFWIYVAYSGWNAPTYVAEEIKRPERTLPLSLTFGTLLVTAIFIAMNVVYIYAAPLEYLKGREFDETVAVGARAAHRLFGPEIAGTFNAFMAIALVATVNAMVTIGPRVYYAMAKNGAFFRAAAEVHPRWHTPVNAILAQGLCAMLMTLTPFPSLVVYIGFSLTFFAALAVASLFVFRRRPGWQKLRVVSFAWPLVPLVFIAVGLVTIAYGVTLKWQISLAAVATITAGALVYHFGFRPGRE